MWEYTHSCSVLYCHLWVDIPGQLCRVHQACRSVRLLLLASDMHPLQRTERVMEMGTLREIMARTDSGVVIFLKRVHDKLEGQSWGQGKKLSKVTFLQPRAGSPDLPTPPCPNMTTLYTRLPFWKRAFGGWYSSIYNETASDRRRRKRRRAAQETCRLTKDGRGLYTHNTGVAIFRRSCLARVMIVVVFASSLFELSNHKRKQVCTLNEGL